MNINLLENINFPCVKPLYDTWGAKSEAGSWTINLLDDFANASVRERNAWYADTMLSTINAFASIARINWVFFNSVDQLKSISEEKSFKWQIDKPYNDFVEKVIDEIREYPDDISSISIHVDLFVYVYTEKSPDKPVQSWVKGFGNYVEIGQFEIYLDQLRYQEHYVEFYIKHMLFYPDSWNYQEDNTELANLNQPLLEEALRKWEKKFDAEIDPDGLNGIYKYGYLPEDQW
ncbi:MAG: hypothetical protein AAFQ91_24495 [Cyanobacteria bacterium J06621_15]